MNDDEFISPQPAKDVILKLDELILGKTTVDIELDLRNENLILSAHMASQASRTLRIFTRELEPRIYDQKDFVAACKKLALRSRFSRIEILAFESKDISRRGHRLVTLAQALSSRIEIRCPDKEYEHHRQTFMTVDESGYIYRRNPERFEGTGNFHDPRKTRELNKFFIEIWQRSQVDTEMRNLHL